MKISGISTRNIYFGQNNKKSGSDTFWPSKKSAVLCAALLTSTPLISSGLKYDFEDTYTPVAGNVSEEINLRKTDYYKDKFTWEKIPDYQKLLALFYSSLALMFLVSMMTSKEKDPGRDINNY